MDPNYNLEIKHSVWINVRGLSLPVKICFFLLVWEPLFAVDCTLLHEQSLTILNNCHDCVRSLYWLAKSQPKFPLKKAFPLRKVRKEKILLIFFRLYFVQKFSYLFLFYLIHLNHLYRTFFVQSTYWKGYRTI